MGIILIRYGELALKSRPVRLRFERTLMRNIEELFLLEGRECILSREWGRIMAHVKDDAAAGKILRRVFGITSFSPAVECSSDKDEVAGVAGDASKALLRDGQSFAIRARRNGTHPYSSQQLGALAGSAVMEANKGRGIRVDLSDPDVEVFIEVRGKRAYVFADKFPGPGGLPMGTQGRVAALLGDDKSAAAAWLMMKRGCRVIAAGAGEDAKTATEMLRSWVPGLKLHELEDASPDGLARFARRRKAEALVVGSTYEELEKGIPVSDLPILFPLCGMGPEEIVGLIGKIRAG